MKKYFYVILLVLSAILTGCNDKNVPQIPWNETGYRLDSMIIYNDDTIAGKEVYFYSMSSLHHDSLYYYVWSKNQWILSEKETYKYDERWNILEISRSRFHEDPYHIDDLWILSTTKNYVYNQNRLCKETIKSWQDRGYSDIYECEYDSLGNTTLEKNIFYHYDEVTFQSAIKHDNYYTGNRLDSVYEYNLLEPFECLSKTIHTEYDNDKCIERLIYRWEDNQFELSNKYTYKFDQFENMTMINLYAWKNNDWVLRVLDERLYLYIANTTLTDEYVEMREDYRIDGSVSWKLNLKNKYYYTKL